MRGGGRSGAVGIRSLLPALLLLVDLFGRTHLSDDVLHERKLHGAGAVLRGEDQFGDPRLDVGHDLVAVLMVGVLGVQALQIGVQRLESIDVQRKGDARYTAFFHGIHSLESILRGC